MSNEIDINTPPSEQEVTDWVNNLSDADKAEVRRLQLLNAATSRKAEKRPNLGAMNSAEWEAYKRSIGL
jgi:hypothetical protein